MPCAGQKNATDQVIQFYQRRAAADPDDYTSFDHLGSSYLQKARETGDPTYYSLSEKSFSQALTLLPAERPEAAATTQHLAALYLAEHRFAESLTLAMKALALDPTTLSAYATLGDAELETGRYAEAAASFAKLNLPPDALPPRPGLAYLFESRESNLSYIKGKPQEAIVHMQAAIRTAIEVNLPKENVAWSQFSLGELYFGVGNLEKAEEYYQAALRTYPKYHRATAWLGQLRAAQGRYEEAAELYREAIAAIPLPGYVAALGDIEAKLGHTEGAQQQYNVVDFIAKLSALNQQLFRRELAVFYADHNIRLQESLEFAQEELQQRQDVYTWDTLAWADFKNGKTDEGAQAIVHALAEGTKDPLIYFHAGMIHERAGDAAKAKEFFEKALAINPNFHIFYADAARQALAKLEQNSKGANGQVSASAH